MFDWRCFRQPQVCCGPQLHAALDAIRDKAGDAYYTGGKKVEELVFTLKFKHIISRIRAQIHWVNLMLGYPGDARDYQIAANMLKSLEIEKVTLLTNNPNKIEQLRSYGIDVVNRENLVVGISDSNRSYLETKVERMGHSIDKNELKD